MFITAIQLAGHTLGVTQVGEYQDGTPAIDMLDVSGTSWARLTACVPGTELAPDEILVKTYSENAALRGPLLATGRFRDTGRRVPAGFVELEVWVVASLRVT